MNPANSSTKKVKLPESSPPFLLRVIITTLLMIVLFGISIAISLYKKEMNPKAPTNFEECTLAKWSIIEESYPPVCVTKKGDRFIKQLSEEEKKLPEPTAQVEKSAFCGGIAGIMCPEGFTCRLDGNYPDAGGTCIPE